MGAIRKIYVASSWRNTEQPGVVERLRALGHLVYDFRNPPLGTGFSWSAIDPHWKAWNVEQWRIALRHPTARAGFAADFGAMKWADTMVLVLPAGRSAHLELGWAVGVGMPTAILATTPQEPELMASMVGEIAASMAELEAWLGGLEDGCACRARLKARELRAIDPLTTAALQKGTK
jgi:hypothetical protein